MPARAACTVQCKKQASNKQPLAELEVMAATGGPENSVIKLHIYDLTGGLAAQLSQAFLGKLQDSQYMYEPIKVRTLQLIIRSVLFYRKAY